MALSRKRGEDVRRAPDGVQRDLRIGNERAHGGDALSSSGEVENVLRKVDDRLPKVEGRSGNVEAELRKVEEGFRDVEGGLRNIEESFRKVGDGFRKVEDRLRNLKDGLATVEARSLKGTAAAGVRHPRAAQRAGVYRKK